MPICLGLPMEVPVVLPTETLTLAWTHSVEKTEWREEWQVADGRLRLLGAAIAGSGAGMEPPPGAVLRDGAWRWSDQEMSVLRLTLVSSGFGGDYGLCWAGSCRPLADLLTPGASGSVEIYPCRHDNQSHPGR